MANPNAPFGFSWRGTLNGPVNFRTGQRLISSSYTTAIFYGDAVVPIVSTATGYIGQATAGSTPLAGIFYGCQYYSTSQKKTVLNNYWPGSDATGDVTAFICDDPDATFLVQAGATNIGFAKTGQNCQLNVGTGNTTTGYSGMFVDTVGTTSTYPFIITGVPNGATDPVATTGYNWIEVAWNYMIYKANTSAGGIS